MRLRQSNVAHFRPLALCMLWLVAACGQPEPPVLSLEVEGWPSAAEAVRLRVTLGSSVRPFLFVRQGERPQISLPAGSGPELQIEAEALDSAQCKIAVGAYSEEIWRPAATTLYRRLELIPTLEPVCLSALKSGVESVVHVCLGE